MSQRRAQGHELRANFDFHSNARQSNWGDMGVGVE